jgi:AraC family transcriptional regulator
MVASVQVSVQPSEAARRQSAHWGGLDAEIVQYTGNQPFEYHFRSDRHLFIACERAARSDGETRIDGLPVSSMKDFGRRMCLVPAGRGFHGWFVPRVLPRTSYFYLDRQQLAADAELDFARVEFTPRLFFQDEALWQTARKLTQLIEQPEPGGRLYADALTQLLAIELVRLEAGNRRPAPPATGGLASWQQRLVCDFIEDNLAEEIALADLARLAKLSTAHFCRAFKRSLGLPPHRYQLQRRIERAKSMLAETDRPITETAILCGFGFASNFTVAFRKVTGVTPSQFRRALA